MNKRVIIIVFLAIFSVSLFAGNETKSSAPETAATASLTLSVKDKITGEPLAGVLITIQETGTKAYTDLEGFCNFQNIPAGKYNISTSYVSYSETVLKEIKVANGLCENIDIQLSPSR